MRRATVDRTRGLWLVGAGLAAAVFLGMWLSMRLTAFRTRLRARADNRRGQRGERVAEKLLRRHGYRPIARQVRGTYPVQLGQQRVEVSLSADFLVERAGRKLVAEVKTGDKAPRFENADTRRQLLEYQLGFQVDSVVLVDVESGELREVRFPITRPISGASLGGYVLAATLSAAICWLVMR